MMKMSLGQFQFQNKINTPAGIAMTIFGIVLGMIVILPILLLLLLAGLVAMIVLIILAIYAKICRIFQTSTGRDSTGRKNVRVRNQARDQS
jgi:uncharacterized membrane protein